MNKYKKIALNKLTGADIYELLINRESYRELINTLHLLPSPKKEIFLMKYVENKNLKEISFETNLSVQKIYYHIHTGKKLLKLYLSNKKEEE